jgi:hypothetical protein
VIKTFAEGELLSWLPFMNIAGGGLFYSVEKELPSVGFRAVNEGYKQSYGVVDPQSEAVHLFGGDVDVDRSIVDLQGPEARAAQTEMKRAIPDARWRFAFQLMAAYRLRPEELQHLQIRQGRLWCMDEKVASPPQELPPMQPGLGGGYGGYDLMNRRRR